MRVAAILLSPVRSLEAIFFLLNKPISKTNSEELRLIMPADLPGYWLFGEFWKLSCIEL